MAAATSNNNISSGGSTTAPAAKQRVGVADYFAIVGVGEKLIWKHAQHKASSSSSQPEEIDTFNEESQGNSNSGINTKSENDNANTAGGNTTPSNGSGTTSDIPEEDDAMLLERFYREIIHVDIVLAQERLELPQQQQQPQHGELESVTATSTTAASTTTTTTVLYTSQPPLSSAATYQHQQPQQLNQAFSWDTAYTSATARSCTSAAPAAVLSVQNTFISSNNKAAVADVEIQEGWTVVQKTRPAAANPMGGSSAHHHHHANKDDPIVWKKGQIWDANLDPMGGITAEIQHLYQQQQLQQQMEQSLGHNSNDASGDDRRRTAPLKGFRNRVQSTFQSKTQQWLPGSAAETCNNVNIANASRRSKFYLTYKRRSPEEPNLPGIADIELYYVRIHKSTIILPRLSTDSPPSVTDDAMNVEQRPITKSRMRATSLLEAGKQAVANRLAAFPSSPLASRNDPMNTGSVVSAGGYYFNDEDEERHRGPPVALESFLVELPNESYQWVVPSPFSFVRFPKENPDYFHHKNKDTSTTTVLYASGDSHTRQGIEAVDRTPPRHSNGSSSHQQQHQTLKDNWKERLRPRLLSPSNKTLMADVASNVSRSQDLGLSHGEQVIMGGPSRSFDFLGEGGLDDEGEYLYVPVLAIRRQRISEEERFLEDPALVDIAVSFKSQSGHGVVPADNVYGFGDDFDEEENDSLATKLLHKSAWQESSLYLLGHDTEQTNQGHLGSTCFLVRRNLPMGFCDAAFSTSVLDRFPYKNYKGLPLPEEELPMFCYPTGCRLHRAKYSDAPLPQYYGFVVKNERGDSIYVSCVSFMEPLTVSKKEQLSKLSEKRSRVALPHKKYWTRRMRRDRMAQNSDSLSEASVASPSDLIPGNDDTEMYYDDGENSLLTAFDQMTTFENKTICLISRYPYWTAFRRFLSHIHSISGASSDLPLERYISHLLLSVPVPKSGGPTILIPLPTFDVPMVLSSPPLKDLPLVDLPFERLLSCLDVPTIITVVLGFLALERKVIVMSSRPSLVLDVCECARALLFPFELVAPYVPRLTEPFMSCLDFPGAIFVGIHDDKSPDGLASTVRQNMPEDSTIVDLDNGSIDCSGDRISVLNNSWGLIPSGPRSVLVSEIETLCRDAGIVPGQEPLDSQLDSAFEASMPNAMVEDDLPLSNEHREPLDDRAVRDAFLRFFCSILGGYERYLVVPDVDFLISGNEWFDTKGFLASTTEEKVPFIGSLVSTQLFQSFIQRRTESSDVHLMLFDECLMEYHSVTVPYGRLGGDVESVFDKDTGRAHMLYSLLVDQSATGSHAALRLDHSFDTDSRGQTSETDNSSGHPMTKSLNSDVTDRLIRFSDFGINATGDWVTLPSKKDIEQGSCFIYCVDGNPTFPDRLNPALFVPRQPESWLIEMSTASTPMLTRSSVERDDAERRRKFSTSYRGMHNQRKCLWQLPKLMGSHFLGTWLLCIPSLVSQTNLTHEHQSKYLLRAFGAMRMLRNKHKIVPDEAAYRALIVACGRTMNDRRSELVKLFGLLRSDGVNPSAVTLGQYTKALAEGYSKRVVGNPDEDGGSVTMTDTETMDGWLGPGTQSIEGFLTLLDSTLASLEDSGRKWRHPNSKRCHRQTGKSWYPVAVSSSLVASSTLIDQAKQSKIQDSVNLFALWSRANACNECSYVPLDEEVMGGWDAIYGGEHDIHGVITCPRCGSLLTPKLAYKEMKLSEAIRCLPGSNGIPPQIAAGIEVPPSSLVTYLSPSSLRDGLEQAVDQHGESILERGKLYRLYPELFINLWWFCSRFQLPLPLAITSEDGETPMHCIAIAAW